MKARQTIAQNLRWLAGTNAIAKPIWFVFLLVSARLLGPWEFGKYMFAISYVAVIAVFLEGGIDIMTVRDLAADPDRYAVLSAHTTFLKVLSGLIVGVVAVASSFMLGVAPESRVLIALAALYSAFFTLVTHFRFLFRGFEVMQYEAWSVMVEKLAVVTLCGSVLFFWRTAEQFLVSFAAAYIVTCAVTLLMVARTLGLPRWSIDVRYLWQKVLKPALPYALMSFFMVIYFRSATLMLKLLTGQEEVVGYYNAGYRIVESFLFFPAIIIGPVYPSFSRRRDDKPFIRSLLLQSGRMILLISVVIAIPVVFFSTEVTQLLFGARYAPAAAAVGIVGLVMIPLGMTWVYGSLVAAIGRQPRANVIIAAVTGANILSHYLLIPRLGLVGAAWVTLGTEIAIAVGNLWVVRDYLTHADLWFLYGRGLGPALLIGLVRALGLLPGSFVLQLVTVVAFLALAYLATGFVKFDDLRKALGKTAA